MFGSYMYKRVSMLSFFEYNNRNKTDPSNGLKTGRENARLATVGSLPTAFLLPEKFGIIWFVLIAYEIAV